MVTDAVSSESAANRGARAQLAALAARAGDEGGGVFARLRPALSGQGRAAAVLILFGELGAPASSREAAIDGSGALDSNAVDALPRDRPARAEVVSRDLDVLFVERASTLRSHAGQIAFPGGRIDPGDSGPVAAALREAREETGLDPAGVEVLGNLGVVPLERSQHLVAPVLGWWREPSPVQVVDEAESASVFRTPVAELLDAANRGSTVIRRAGHEWRGPAFIAHAGGREHLVWGFTAMLLDALFDELGWAEPWDASREFPLVGAPAPRGEFNED